MKTTLPSDLVAQLQGFLVVADTLNISQAAEILNVSRVTLQNRIKKLEAFCEFNLLEFDDRNRYKLTSRGENWAQQVRVWLRQGADMFSLPEERAGALLQSSAQENGEPFFWQQHPITSIWEHDTHYLRSMLSAWIDSKAQYDSAKFKTISDNAFLVRLCDDDFIIMGVGKDAALMNWLGRKWCLSAVGKTLASTAVSTKADQIVTYAYRQAISLGSPWYDHVSMDLPRPVKGTSERAHYRRLVLPCKLPDGSPLIASVVELSEDLVIGGFDVSRIHQSTRES